MATDLTKYEYEDCVCTNVVDGDTIDVSIEVDIGFKMVAVTAQRIRLLGIDTPELRPRRGTPEERTAEKIAAKKATEHVKEKILGKKIKIRTKKDPDSFGRYLAIIFYRTPEREYTPKGSTRIGPVETENDLNQELLDLGLAVEYKKK